MHTFLHCALCSKVCTLQECAIDEHGRGAHYQCLADKFVKEENELRWQLKDYVFINQPS
jgi:hypothetical protein